VDDRTRQPYHQKVKKINGLGATPTVETLYFRQLIAKVLGKLRKSASIEFDKSLTPPGDEPISTEKEPEDGNPIPDEKIDEDPCRQSC
jgi:hypothetical protein